MSNEFIQASEDANRLLAGFSAVATLSTAFAKAGQVQQAQTEAEARLAELQPLLGKAKSDIEFAETTLRAAELQAKQIIADGEAVAEKTKANAVVLATEIIAEAEAHAEGVHGQCKEDCAVAAVTLQAIEAKRDAVLAEVQAIESRAAEARAFLAKLQG